MNHKEELKEVIKRAEVKMNVVSASIDKIFPNTWNPNKQTDFIYSKEVKSIKKFGFVLPVLVREIPEGYEIIDGEHRWKAGQEAGLEHIPVNNLGKVSDAVAKQLTIVMNETRGRAERTDLSKLLRNLSDEIGLDNLTDIMPFGEAEMSAFLNEDAIDWQNLSPDKPTESGPGGPQDDDFKTVSLRLPSDVANQLEGQIERFKLALHPDEDPAEVSSVMAMEAMIQHLAQIPDEQLIG